MTKTEFPGHELRRRREELGLSVYEVFRNTHVPTQFIEALEKSDLKKLPGSCYAIGYIKSYCALLDLDGERFVDTFRSCVRPSEPVRFLGRKKETKIAAPSWMNDVVAWAVVMGIVLLGWLTYSVVFAPRADVNDRAVDAVTIDNTPAPSAMDRFVP